MLQLGMMCFVKYEKVDLAHSDETVKKALMEDFCSADDDFVFIEMLVPGRLVPQVSTHGSCQTCNFMVQITIEDRSLLKGQCDGIDLAQVSEAHAPAMERKAYDKEGYARRFASLPVFKFLIKNVSKK